MSWLLVGNWALTEVQVRSYRGAVYSLPSHPSSHILSKSLRACKTSKMLIERIWIRYSNGATYLLYTSLPRYDTGVQTINRINAWKCRKICRWEIVDPDLRTKLAEMWGLAEVSIDAKPSQSHFAFPSLTRKHSHCSLSLYCTARYPKSKKGRRLILASQSRSLVCNACTAHGENKMSSSICVEGAEALLLFRGKILEKAIEVGNHAFILLEYL